MYVFKFDIKNSKNKTKNMILKSCEFQLHKFRNQLFFLRSKNYIVIKILYINLCPKSFSLKHYIFKKIKLM